MLVLTRKIEEQIILPDLAVTISVLSISGGRVKLGVSAPPEMRILRREVLLRQLNSNGDERVPRDSRDFVSIPGLDAKRDS